MLTTTVTLELLLGCKNAAFHARDYYKQLLRENPPSKFENVYESSFSRYDKLYRDLEVLINNNLEDKK